MKGLPYPYQSVREVFRLNQYTFAHLPTLPPRPSLSIFLEGIMSELGTRPRSLPISCLPTSFIRVRMECVLGSLESRFLTSLRPPSLALLYREVLNARPDVEVRRNAHWEHIRVLWPEANAQETCTAFLGTVKTGLDILALSPEVYRQLCQGRSSQCQFLGSRERFPVVKRSSARRASNLGKAVSLRSPLGLEGTPPLVRYCHWSRSILRIAKAGVLPLVPATSRSRAQGHCLQRTVYELLLTNCRGTFFKRAEDSTFFHLLCLNHGVQEGYAEDGSRFVQEHCFHDLRAHNRLPVILYVEPKEEKPADFGSTLTSTMPMAAVSMVLFYSGFSADCNDRCSREIGKKPMPQPRSVAANEDDQNARLVRGCAVQHR